MRMILVVFLFLSLFVILAGVSVGVFINHQLQIFTQAAQTTPQELIAAIKSGWRSEPTHTNYHKNILILGVDTLSTRGNSQPLTDTITIASIDLKSGEIRTVSLPRDLWSSDYQTKINALYYYGQSKYPDEPQQFPTMVIQGLTSVPLHHTLVLSLPKVAQLVDLLGGIDVEIPQSFTDTQFPRPDVDVTRERDPLKLYQTVSFTSGTEHMNGERALQYIRSRHADGATGDDISRQQRQQLVIQALIHTALDKKNIFDPQKMGQLYYFYQQNFASSLPLTEVIATGKYLGQALTEIKFTPQSLTYYPENALGVLFHPPASQYNGQWVYVMTDPKLFQKEITSKLNLQLDN